EGAVIFGGQQWLDLFLETEAAAEIRLFHRVMIPQWFLSGYGDTDREGRAGSFGAGYVDGSAEQLGKTARNSQAEAGTAGCAGGSVLQLAERLENSIEIGHRNARTGVGDTNRHPGFIASTNDGDRACAGEFDRIADQVDENLP